MFGRLLLTAILVLQTTVPAQAVGETQFYYRHTKTGVISPINEEPPAEPPQSTIAPDIADQSQTLLGTAGSAISTWTPKAQSGWPSAVIENGTSKAWSLPGISYSANYDLTQYGLALNSQTGAISGTPNRSFAINDFTITVTANSQSDTTAPFRIAASPASALSVSASQKDTYSVRAGTAFSTDAIQVDNAVGTVTFSKPANIEDYAWDTSTGTLIWTSATTGTESYTTTITDELNRGISWTFNVAYQPVLAIETLNAVDLIGTWTYDGSSTVRKPSASGLVGDPFWFAGDMPAGLTYDISTGVITGSVTDSAQQGEHNVPVMVFDDADASQASGILTINIKPPFHAWSSFTGASLKQGTDMTPVGFNIRDSGSNTPYATHGLSWTMVSGSIPPGLASTASGELFTFSGRPTAQGTFTSIWKATDNRGWSLTLNPITFIVEARDPLTLNAISDRTAIGNKTYTDGEPIVQATATNLVGSPTWSATGLPTGLSINSATGAITGTVTNGNFQGDQIVTVMITDNGDGTTISTSFKLTILSPFIAQAYTGATLKQQVPMTAAGFNLRDRQSNTPYSNKGVTATLVSGSLPTGLNASISNEFLLFSGTPTVSGTFFSTWRVTDGNGWSISLPTIMFKVDPRATLAISGILPTTIRGETIFTEASPVRKATASNLIGTASWTATGLPTGLTIASTGSIIGSVTNSALQGEHNVTVNVSDSGDGATASASALLTVVAPFTSFNYTGATLTLNTAMTPGGFNIRGAGNTAYRNKGLGATMMSGSLPPGISVSIASGSELVVFSGTPTATGTFKSVWKVTDINGWSLTLPEITFTVNP